MLQSAMARENDRNEVRTVDIESERRHVPEIEITAEMIAAGVSAMGDYEAGWDNLADFVTKTYKAMARAAGETKSEHRS